MYILICTNTWFQVLRTPEWWINELLCVLKCSWLWPTDWTLKLRRVTDDSTSQKKKKNVLNTNKKKRKTLGFCKAFKPAKTNPSLFVPQKTRVLRFKNNQAEIKRRAAFRSSKYIKIKVKSIKKERKCGLVFLCCSTVCVCIMCLCIG